MMEGQNAVVYESPAVRVIEVEVEKGFAVSGYAEGEGSGFGRG